MPDSGTTPLGVFSPESFVRSCFSFVLLLNQGEVGHSAGQAPGTFFMRLTFLLSAKHSDFAFMATPPRGGMTCHRLTQKGASNELPLQSTLPRGVFGCNNHNVRRRCSRRRC